MLFKRCIGLCCIVAASASSCNNQEGQPSLPSIITVDVTGIMTNRAVSGGIIMAASGPEVLVRGVCWSTHPMPTLQDNKTADGSGPGTFSSQLTGLHSDKAYYLRAYATTATGTRYGNSTHFSTLLTDSDGNVYQTVTIGIQIWMVENLKVTQLTDGTPLQLVTEDNEWGFAPAGYSWYENNENQFKKDYGALYNWYAVNTGKLCPIGWHVPTDREWTALTNFLGGDSRAGGRLKETGNLHWYRPNGAASNETGFYALPGGARGFDGSFFGMGEGGAWWTSTDASYFESDFAGLSMQVNAGRAWARFMDLYTGNVYRENHPEMNGYSVRCVKTVH